MYEPAPSDDEGLFPSDQSRASLGKDRPDRRVAQRSLDELFSLTSQYRSGKKYGELLRFITRFKRYSPFNSMLIHIQMPGAVDVATPSRWLDDYGRRCRPNARPILLLQPKGPVLFVFDISDTERVEATEKEDVPKKVESPFDVRSGYIQPKTLDQLIDNAKRDGVRVLHAHHGATRAGSIRMTSAGDAHVRFGDEQVLLRYDLVLSDHLNREAEYATLVHELAHLYCGHQGTPNSRWWPCRRMIKRAAREFEAESVAYLVCRRRGIDAASEEYLSGYMKSDDDIPHISFDRVVTVAGLIEKMSVGKLKSRTET